MQVKERHFYKTTSSIWLGLVKGGEGELKALLCTYQVVTHPENNCLGVVTHILVPHCCTRNYYFVVVWLNQKGEPSQANYYQFKTEPMNKFAVDAARGAQDPENIVMVAPEETLFIQRVLDLASECLGSFLATFLCTNTSNVLVNSSGASEGLGPRSHGRVQLFTINNRVKDRGNKKGQAHATSTESPPNEQALVEKAFAVATKAATAVAKIESTLQEVIAIAREVKDVNAKAPGDPDLQAQLHTQFAKEKDEFVTKLLKEKDERLKEKDERLKDSKEDKGEVYKMMATQQRFALNLAALFTNNGMKTKKPNNSKRKRSIQSSGSDSDA